MNKITELFMAYKSEFTKSSLKNNDLIEFGIPFNYANLNNIFNGTIYLYSCNQEISLKDSLHLLDESIEKGNILRVWSSHIDPDYYMFLLFICFYLKDKVSSLEVFYSEEYKSECTSTGVMTSEELDKLSLMGHTLNKDEIMNLASEWEKLNKDGSKVHIFENGQLIDVEYEYIYEQINDILKKEGNTPIVNIVLNLAKKYHIFTEYLIQRMINEKRIKIVKKEKIFAKSIVGLINNINNSR
jgi:hypothetical protein